MTGVSASALVSSSRASSLHVVPVRGAAVASTLSTSGRAECALAASPRSATQHNSRRCSILIRCLQSGHVTLLCVTERSVVPGVSMHDPHAQSSTFPVLDMTPVMSLKHARTVDV